MFILTMLFFNNLIHLPTPFIGAKFYDVKQNDSLLFFSTVRGLEVYRWDPINPLFISRSSTVGWAVAVDISGIYAYLADHYNGLVIYDITDPAAPAQVGSYDTDGFAWDVSIAGNYAFVADYNNGLVVLDISDPSNPLLIGHCPDSDDNQSITLSDTLALMGSDGPMKLINIADPANPYILSRFPDESSFDFGWDACIEDTLVYLNGMKWLPQGMPYRFMIYNIAVPTNPRLISGFHIENGTNRGIVKTGSYICTNGQDGRVFIIDVTNPFAPCLINYYSENHYFGPSLASCDSFVIAPHYIEGFSIINVADPYHIIPTYRHTNNIIWGDFIVDESHNNMFAIGRIFCNSGWESYSTLKIADISDPEDPVIYGAFSFSGKACMYENSFDYPYLAVTINRDGPAYPYYTALMNLSNPTNPVLEKFVEGGGVSDIHLPYVYSLSDDKIRTADISNPDFWIDSIALASPGHYLIINDTVAYITIDNSLLILNITTGNTIGSYYHERLFAYKMSLDYPHLAIACTPNFFNYGFLIFDVSDPTAPALLHEEVISVPNLDPSYCIIGCHLEDTLLFMGLADFGFDIWKIKLPDSVYRILRQDTPQNATTDPYGNTGIFFMNGVIYVKDESCIELYKWTETSLEEFSKNDLRTQLDYISAYPNPAHHTVNFKLHTNGLKQKDRITVKIYNAAGELVRVLLHKTGSSALPSTLMWDGIDDNRKPAPHGLYFVKLTSGLESCLTKVILIK